MKKKFNLIMITLFAGFIIAGFNSCEKIKDKIDEQKVEPQSGKDYVTAESSFSNVYKTVSDVIQDNDLNNKSISAICATVTISGDYPAKTVKIEFPTEGCVIEGVTFKGTINVVMTKPFKTSGSVVEVTLDSVYVNDNKVEGTKTITNTGKNASEQYVIKVEVKSGHITTKDGNNIYYSTTKYWTWFAGEPTKAINDDIWLVEGNASGINIEGKTFTVTTTTPCKILVQGCSENTEVVSGVIEVVPESGQSMTINYGDGTCDNKVTIKIGDLADIVVKLL
jgi:uncharacterized cupin superfamily protein